ncbi:hypothetical protein C8J57DRAFT_1314720 [Mycena rebaudengoi]|nr:hypothetical protein C8J57DRAFT_1314720 [Mycena rebaudengoi]
MEAHPSYQALAHAYNDILLVDLEGVSRAAIRGKMPKTTLSFSWLITAFPLLSDPPEIYLAITSDDASLVYYKISGGFVKPQV